MNLEILEKESQKLLKTQKQITIGITGLPGSGKSTFGKQLRKNGFGCFNLIK